MLQHEVRSRFSNEMASCLQKWLTVNADYLLTANYSYLKACWILNYWRMMAYSIKYSPGDYYLWEEGRCINDSLISELKWEVLYTVYQKWLVKIVTRIFLKFSFHSLQFYINSKIPQSTIVDERTKKAPIQGIGPATVRVQDGSIPTGAAKIGAFFEPSSSSLS